MGKKVKFGKQRFDLDLTIAYDGDDDDTCNALCRFWKEIETKLEKLQEDYGVEYSHGDIVTYPR
jgi:hypothetical protein